LSQEYVVPEDLYYHREHTWARVEGDEVRVGLTDYAQKALRDIVLVEVVSLGQEVSQGESIGTVESIKAVSDLVAPVSGEVAEFNSELQASPDLVNRDPYGDGWIVVMKPTNLEEDLKNLLDAKSYLEYVKQL